jgi:hypothetical protein
MKDGQKPSDDSRAMYLLGFCLGPGARRGADDDLT